MDDSRIKIDRIIVIKNENGEYVEIKGIKDLEIKFEPKMIINILNLNNIKLNFYQKILIYIYWYKYRIKEVFYEERNKCD